MAEGITIVTHESNKDFYEKAWARPRTFEDTAPTSNKPMIETVGDKKVLSDRTRTVELYYLAGHQHHSGQLIAYLPKERILMYGDAYNPPAGNEIRTPERGPEYAAQLVQKINELKLNPDRIAPVHGEQPSERIRHFTRVTGSPGAASANRIPPRASITTSRSLA